MRRTGQLSHHDFHVFGLPRAHTGFAISDGADGCPPFLVSPPNQGFDAGNVQQALSKLKEREARVIFAAVPDLEVLALAAQAAGMMNANGYAWLLVGSEHDPEQVAQQSR